MQFQLGLSHPLWPQPPTFFSEQAVTVDAVVCPGVFLWMGTHRNLIDIPPSIPSEELSQILQLKNETKNGICLQMFFSLGTG